MHILFVTPTLPVPTSGGRTRSFNLIKQLATRHEVSVLSFIQSTERTALSRLEPFCKRLELIPIEGFRPLGKWHNRLQGWSRILFSRRPRHVYTFPVDKMRTPLRCLLQTHTFDVVVLDTLYLVELLDQVCSTPAILAEQNVESDIVRRSYSEVSSPMHKLRDWLMWRKLLAFEQRWVRRFPVCVGVSERDAAMLRAISPGTTVHVVPNGVNSRSFAPPAGRCDAGTLLFFGTLSYGPNADGLVWFCEQVLPRVRQSKPDVRLEVVGLDPPPRVTALGRLPGVQVTGFVPDIRPKLWSATMCVVPLLAGGGTRLKILEALAAGCPVISTTVGAEGLELMDGKHLLIADDPEEFARDVVALLESDALRHRLADAGRRAVAEKYDWQEIAPRLEAACIQAVKQHARG
jgi:glycosyltransferase involved in cell wall biosynthesis